MNTVFLMVVVELSMEGVVESAKRISPPPFNDSTAGQGGPSIVGIGIQGEHP
jgi:hypothetical protein